MAKLDLKKTLKHLYNPSAKAISEVDVPPMKFLMIDGYANPNTAPAFQESLQALYALAFAIKFASKNSAAGIDYGVMPTEGLWWMDDMGTRYGDFDFTADKRRWKWTMMIMQPDHITPEMVSATVADVQRKKNLPAVDRVRFERLEEGRAVQIMHLGSYDDEKPTLDRLHHYIEEHGFEATGKHHEIYLNDPSRTQPARLRTVIRQPMRGR
jgi:hypothetical protein